jgi:hypothetical protein
MKSVNLPTERFHRAVTWLGEAITKFNSSEEGLKESLDGLKESIQLQDEVSKPSKDEEALIFVMEQKSALVKASSSVGKLAPLLEGTELIPGFTKNSASAYIELQKAHKDLLEMQEAVALGIIDEREASTDLKKLRKSLGIAQRKAEGLPEGVDMGDDLQKGSGSSSLSGVSSLVKSGLQALGGQVGGIATGSIGLLGSLPVVGGLFGLMLYGFKERDRMKAQLGELTNIAIGAGAKGTEEGVSWLAGFQERSQNFYGISRQSIQGIFKTFTDAGMAVNDIFKQQSASLGEVGHDAVTMTLGMDRVFELGNGTTARNAAKIMSSYGVSLSSAIDSLVNIEFAASKAGFGVNTFLNWLMQSTMQVRNLGITTDQMADAALEMQRKMSEEGFSHSQTWAMQSVGEAAQGLANMGTGRQIWMAEELGLGKGLAGRQNLMQGFQEDRPELFAKAAGLYRKEAMQATGGDQDASLFYLERLGFGFQGAKAILHLGEMEEKGLKIEIASSADKKALREAFQVEGKKKSSIGEMIRDATLGMAKIGQGILVMLSNFLGWIITSVKAIPVLMSVGTPEQKQIVYKELGERFDGMAMGWNDIRMGGKQAYAGMAGIIKPLLAPIDKAFNYKMGSSHLESRDPIEVDIESLPMVDSPPGHQSTQVGFTPKGKPLNPHTSSASGPSPQSPTSTGAPNHSSTPPHGTKTSFFDPKHVQVIWAPGADRADHLTVEISVTT